MTIKKSWTTTIPILGKEIRRTRILKPGHKEKVILVIWDAEQKSRQFPKRVLTVLTPDSVSLKEFGEPTSSYLTPESKDKLLRGEVTDINKLKFEPKLQEEIYEKDEINTRMVDTKRLDDHMHEDTKLFPFPGELGKEIHISWEPTLSHRTRR